MTTSSEVHEVGVTPIRLQIPSLTPRQLRAVDAIITTPSIRQAAKVAKVDAKTLRGWMRSEPFRSEVQQATRQLRAQAVALLGPGMAEAVECLRAVVADDDAPAGVQVRACAELLNFGLSAADEEVEGRLAALEAERTTWPA